jgi:isochorismate synthase
MLAESPPLDREPAYRAALARARRLDRPVLASWTRAIGPRSALAFFAEGFAHAAEGRERALWLRPDRGEALVALGAARVLVGRGTARFRQVAEAWRALLADAAIDPGDSGTAAATPGPGGPRLLGGFSFDPRRAPSAPWADFGDGRMVLPERKLVVHAGRSWLTTNVVLDPRQARPAPAEPAADPLPLADVDVAPATLSPEGWHSVVGAMARGISAGDLGVQKVVLARAEVVRLRRGADAPAVLTRLAETYPSCTIFAVARGTSCFLGATPERLVALRDGLASTMALAGSAPRGATPAEDERLADELLHDSKQRREHAVVVEALRADLAASSLGARVVAQTEPRVTRLPNVQHLLTPIRARVAPETGVLDLVERLHPTPAMGGYPRQRALELIRAHEALDRGWYAAPLGWVDAQGQGEFVVGIRSALVRAQWAMLFAGCGIVAGSDPANEYAEAGWKLRPMRAALALQP